MTYYVKFSPLESSEAASVPSTMGYAAARFNEIAGEPIFDENCEKNRNALMFSDDPYIGGMLLYENADGSEFACIVESVWMDEKKRKMIRTSERSGQHCVFRTVCRRDNRRGSWGMGNDWHLHGCIINPACVIWSEDIPTAPVRFLQRGHDVRVMQFLLNLHGYDVDIDGHFGTRTRNALGTFQSDQQLTVDHVCAGDTLRALLLGVFVL